MTSNDRPLERIFRDESGKAVATLVRLFGDIDIAEEAVQEAFVVASERWERDGLPPNPGAWIITTCLLYTSPSPRDGLLSRMPSSA